MVDPSSVVSVKGQCEPEVEHPFAIAAGSGDIHPHHLHAGSEPESVAHRHLVTRAHRPREAELLLQRIGAVAVVVDEVLPIAAEAAPGADVQAAGGDGIEPGAEHRGRDGLEGTIAGDVEPGKALEPDPERLPHAGAEADA